MDKTERKRLKNQAKQRIQHQSAIKSGTAFGETNDQLTSAEMSMKTASDGDITLNSTVYYGDQAIVHMLNAVVLELRYLRREIANLKDDRPQNNAHQAKRD